ncbi:hypothetical protein QBC44DRAFT_349555 [Cladorrhinum sp. PSN332]|nr:hypothetical protein QBC44DRAFT_349555 [Cladorrhinum sp. PSN332]
MLGARIIALRGGGTLRRGLSRVEVLHLARSPRIFSCPNTTAASQERERIYPTQNGGDREAAIDIAAAPGSPDLEIELSMEQLWQWHQMTPEEQSRERWIHKNKDLLSMDWGQDVDRGECTTYHSDNTPYSPTKVLATLLRIKPQNWKPRHWRLARLIAANRSLRYPIMAVQLLLRRNAMLACQQGKLWTIERYLDDTNSWNARLEEFRLASGVTEDDMINWFWIFSSESSDTMVERFFSSNCRKPLFLVHMLVAKDKALHKPETFMSIINYVHENYVLRDRPESEDGGYYAQPLARDMTWWHFALMIHRLVWHARDSWPTAIPALARLTADYIRTIPNQVNGSSMSGTEIRCLLFNKAMQYFSWPARIQPLAHMEYNWEAQKHLLAIAPEFEPALVLTHNSYRAIRSVLLGLPKSQAEAKNSDRSAKTWPPFRQTVDGIDERRDPVDDLSRSAKAGLLAREAGYPDAALDKALSALGGSTFGHSPTIQTRSLAQPRWSGKLASLNWYTEWSMRVRATKNPREAWMAFERPPFPNLKPDIQVYAEMFDKLRAAQVTESSTVRPGDSKEVFPVFNGNLTAFAIARLTPPKPDELYDLMLNDGIRPTGHCLEILIKMAPKKGQALRLLYDSPWNQFVEPLRNWKKWKEPKTMMLLRRLPLGILNAWIYMLCNVQKTYAAHWKGPSQHDQGRQHQEPQHDKDFSSPIPEARPSTIAEAIELAYRFQYYNLKAAKHDRKPWHTILKFLAKDKVLYNSYMADSGDNIETTLVAFMQIYEQAVSTQGNDSVFFMSLCVMIRKILTWATIRHRDGAYEERKKLLAQPLVESLIGLAHKYAVNSFDELAMPMSRAGEAGGERELHPKAAMRYNIAGGAAYRYMLAMGCCGNTHEMVKLMDWILDGWNSDYVTEGVKTPLHVGYAYVVRTFTYFVQMSPHLGVPEEEVMRLRERVEGLIENYDCTWFWPEVEEQHDDEERSALCEPEIEDQPAAPSISESPPPFKIEQSRNIYVELPKSTLVTPRSQHEGFVRPLPATKERDAVKALMEALEARGEDPARQDFIEFDLEQFAVYRNDHYSGSEMRTLSFFSTKNQDGRYFTDGILSCGDVKFWVEKMEILELPIGNYGAANPSVGGEIWARSCLNANREVYYKLGKPAVEYQRFHDPFLWVANLAKHVVDYSGWLIGNGREVGVESFRKDFLEWLLKRHGRHSGFQKWRRQHPSPDFRSSDIDRIQVGDTISTPRDGESTDTKWKTMGAKGIVEDHRWFGLVQKVHVAKDGFRSFDVTWFYRPVDTPCCMMKYPWPKELFFSDHCTCEEGGDKKVQETEVLAVHNNFDWFVGPEDFPGKGDFFVRQMYVVEHRRFVTLEKGHLRCSHQAERLRFKTGDTVLAVTNPSDAFSEPYEVVKHFKQGSTAFVRLRKLLRRHRVDPGSKTPPNELVYTEKFIVVKPDKILGKCVVRFFRAGEQIPSPYSRRGTGNLFYITHRLELQDGHSHSPSLLPYDERSSFPTSLRQGFDPQQPLQRLKGLDLFCGAGNLGRGLEDGGAVDMLWANDIKGQAIQTYMLNTPNPGRAHPFLGSVDDLLRLALEGKYADNVPRPGDVDLISAGSPCPGFSLLTFNRSTLDQIKNQSLVASFASFIDFYRPKYALLENVPSIVQAAHNRSEDALSQLFCAIIGLGYQAQLILGDAWSYGAPQSRTRVFLWIAAPGLKLPEPPELSHSHYPSATGRGLGRLCTNEAYVNRSFSATPFKYVSAEEATGDLPRINDAKVESCVDYPDHRVGRTTTKSIRQCINAIPCHPHGMSIRKAWNGGKGVMDNETAKLFLPKEDTPQERRDRLEDTQGWSRVKPTDVFSTVTATIPSPGDRRVAKTLHWVEGRSLTVMEIRRAQGFLDDDVLVGSVADRWRLVGNSVARPMSLALGLKLREAWVGSLSEVKATADNDDDAVLFWVEGVDVVM